MAAMPGHPTLSIALRTLAAERGLSDDELAVSAGISPGATAAFLARPSTPTHTWLMLLATLGCALEVRAAGRSLAVALPRPAAARLAHERRQWAARRLAAFRAQIMRQSPDAKSATANRAAQAYVEASAARLDDELAAARARLACTGLTRSVSGLRAAARVTAAAATVNAEDLSLLAGISLGAAQAGIGLAPDGRLATPHRLFSALAARLVVLPAGGGALTIDLAPPGDWRPEAARSGRSTLDSAHIRARAAAGESLSSIARAAGVSRQRVHAIVRSA